MRISIERTFTSKGDMGPACRLEQRRKRFIRPILMWAQNRECYVCCKNRDEFNREFDTHRIKPGTDGGKYTVNNTILVCTNCHRKIEGLSWGQLKLYMENLYV